MFNFYLLICIKITILKYVIFDVGELTKIKCTKRNCDEMLIKTKEIAIPAKNAE